MRFTYSRWDGSQQIASFDPEDMLEAMADDLISDGDLKRSLRRLMEWGGENRFGDRIMGMQEMMERLRNQRRRQLDRYDLNSIIDDIKEKLDQVKQLERDGIEQKLAEARGEKRPPSDQGENSADSQDQDGQTGEDGEQSPAGSEKPQGGQQSGRQSGQRSQSGQRMQGGQQQGGQQDQNGEQGDGSEPGQQSGQDGQGAPNDALREMLEKMANRKLQYIDELPEDVGGAIKSLTEYEFMDNKARDLFQELLQQLQQQVLNKTFQGMQQALQSMTPEDISKLRDMVHDLNKMLQDRANGKNPDFNEFMEKHGQFFPPGMQNLDELMEHLAQQMSQMQSLMQSMSPEMRDQLQSAISAMLGDGQLQDELANLASAIEQMMPGAFNQQKYPFRGDESMSLDEAMRMMEKLQDMDSLEKDLRGVRDYEDLEKIDAEKVRDLIGDEEAENLDEMKKLTEQLEEAGLIEKKNGKFELTPRAIRKIGNKALRDIFTNLQRNGFGNHDLRDQRGYGGERLDESKRYEFGDPFQMDIQRTVMNGVLRGGSGTPLRLTPDDFEVYRNEQITQSSTVLLLDMSRSMLLRNCFLAAKKVAMALQSLIKMQFPKDDLLTIGFSYIARELKPESLTSLSWEEYEYGTNLQHGLQLAREHLVKSKNPNRQIIVITDGEPTAHIEGGRVQFAYPPTFRTIQETLKEVRRCTKERIVINTFMLETGDYLMDFVDQMTKINNGRAFFATPDRLGEYILVDYVSNKKKKIA